MVAFQLPLTGTGKAILSGNQVARWLLFYGWFYKLALLDFELIFEVKMQESEGV